MNDMQDGPMDGKGNYYEDSNVDKIIKSGRIMYYEDIKKAFELKFPSLINKRLKHKDMDSGYCLSNICEVDFSTNYYYNEADVENNCVDLKRVNDMINRRIKLYSTELDKYPSSPSSIGYECVIQVLTNLLNEVQDETFRT